MAPEYEATSPSVPRMYSQLTLRHKETVSNTRNLWTTQATVPNLGDDVNHHQYD